jgi:hypothetical protein
MVGEKEKAARRNNKVREDVVVGQVRGMRDARGNFVVDKGVCEKVSHYQAQFVRNKTPLLSNQNSAMLNKIFQKKSLPYTYSNSTM